MDCTVLIADDDVNSRIIAETLLRLRGLNVRVAANGTEACDIIRHEDVAVVVLDLCSPGMNGFEVLRRLRGRFGPPALSPTPRILAVTDQQEPEVEGFALQLGADLVLCKPHAPLQFIRAVETLARDAATRAA